MSDAAVDRPVDGKNAIAAGPVPSLRNGLVFWTVFSVIAVAVRGVRWDETLEQAQLLLGTVPYPAGHPYAVIEHNAFTINHLVSTAVLWLTGPAGVCWFRNVLSLWLTLLPVFMLGVLVGRRKLAGHVAVVLVLLNTLSPFASYYPLAVWPNGFSSGPVGMGYGLMCFYFLVAGRIRLAFFLIGLMPLIHIGQAPMMYAVGGLFGLWLIGFHREKALPAVGYTLLGLAFCALFLVLKQRFLDVLLPASGPYYSPEDYWPIWQAFTELYDVHGVRPRFAHLSHRNIVLVVMLVLGAAATWIEWRKAGKARVCFWFWIFGVSASLIIWAVALLQYALGKGASFYLVSWMPYRFSNHVSVLALILAVGLLFRGGGAKTLLIPAVLAYEALSPLLGSIVPEAIYTRYIGGALEVPAFVLWGGALAAVALELRTVTRRAWVVWVGYAIGLAALSYYHRYGALCSVAGTGFVLAAAFFEKRPASVRWERYATTFATGILLAIVLGDRMVREYENRSHLEVAGIERRIVAILDQNGDRDAMLLAPYWQIFLQARTGHPVMADYQTPHYMTYIPALAPSLKKLHLDVFGKAIDQPYEQDLDEWAIRTQAQWQALGRQYDVWYVLCPEEVPLNLPWMLRGNRMVFYRIPKGA